MDFNAQYNSKEREFEMINGAKAGAFNMLTNVLLKVDGGTSDGYHTFDELYHHRMMLFAVICNTYKNKAWKSWKHDDGTMYDDYFIVGVETPEGQYTYHYHKDFWYLFEVYQMELAPKWDGHKPEDISRLFSLIK